MAIHWNDGSVSDVGTVLEITKQYNNYEWGADHTMAAVWDDEKQIVAHRILSSMYGSMGSEQVSTNAKSWEVDASNELRAKVEAILSDRRAKAAEIRWMDQNLERALNVEKGKVVRVYKGRKLPIGTQGVIKWTGTNNWGVLNVGIKVEGEAKLQYTSIDNVKVVLPSWWTPCDYACDAVEY